LAHDARVANRKMFGPLLPAWVKELSQFAGRWIQRGNIRTLIEITAATGPAQIYCLIVAAVLFCYNMLNMEGPLIGYFWQQAIFTTTTSALPN
jgi:hypothetical protein